MRHETNESSDQGGLVPGQQVGTGRFILVRPLGQGGVGVVWLAQDTELQDQVALKFLPPEIAHSPQALHDLRKEAQRSRRLSHPNIVRIHDLHRAPDEPAFISMEYVEGQTLLALKAEQELRCLTWEFLEPRVRQLCAALDYAHLEHLVHRDLKPANLMLDWRWQVKVADFGLAAALVETMSRVTNSGAASGKSCYMSPQQIEGTPPKPADDLYALGATLYELLTSQPPFSKGDILQHTRLTPVTPIAERQRELNIVNPVPPAVAAAIMACLEKEPARRPPSAQSLADWLGLASKSDSSLGQLVQSGSPTVTDADARLADHRNSAEESTPQEPSGWLRTTLLLLLAIVIGVVAAQEWNRRTATAAGAAQLEAVQSRAGSPATMPPADSFQPAQPLMPQPAPSPPAALVAPPATKAMPGAVFGQPPSGSPPSVTPKPPVKTVLTRSGTTAIRGTYPWNPETNAQGNNQAADLHWQIVNASTARLAPINGAQAAILTGSTFEQIGGAAIAGAQLSRDPIPRTSLGQGVVVVFRTVEGNLGKLQVLAYEPLGRPGTVGYISAYNLRVRWALYER